MEDLGKRIKKCRIENRMNQQQLADKLNVIRQTVSHWENGIRRPDAEMLKDLAALFNVSSDYLLGNNKVHNSKEQRIEDAFNYIEETYGTDTTVLFKDIASFDEGERVKLKAIIDLIKSNKN